MTNCQYTQLQVSFLPRRLCQFPASWQPALTVSRVVVLQEYVRLIGPWCQVNIGSCRFMLAQCYLADGEGQKVGGPEGVEDILYPPIPRCAVLSSSLSSSSVHFLCPPQALQCFQEAATEVEKEEFLMRLTSSEDEEAAASTRLQYYNKVLSQYQNAHACDPFRVKAFWLICLLGWTAGR